MSTFTCFADHEGRNGPVVIDTTGRDAGHVYLDHMAREHRDGTTGGLTVAEYEEWRRSNHQQTAA